jgi:hypothetical protein
MSLIAYLDRAHCSSHRALIMAHRFKIIAAESIAETGGCRQPASAAAR